MEKQIIPREVIMWTIKGALIVAPLVGIAVSISDHLTPNSQRFSARDRYGYGIPSSSLSHPTFLTEQDWAVLDELSIPNRYRIERRDRWSTEVIEREEERVFQSALAELQPAEKETIIQKTNQYIEAVKRYVIPEQAQAYLLNGIDPTQGFEIFYRNYYRNAEDIQLGNGFSKFTWMPSLSSKNWFGPQVRLTLQYQKDNPQFVVIEGNLHAPPDSNVFGKDVNLGEIDDKEWADTLEGIVPKFTVDKTFPIDPDSTTIGDLDGSLSTESASTARVFEGKLEVTGIPVQVAMFKNGYFYVSIGYPLQDSNL